MAISLAGAALGPVLPTPVRAVCRSAVSEASASPRMHSHSASLAIALTAGFCRHASFSRRSRTSRMCQWQGVDLEDAILSKVNDKLQKMYKLKARELARELRNMGLDTTGHVNKESLIELLQAQGRRVLRDQVEMEAQVGAIISEEQANKEVEVGREMHRLRGMSARELLSEMEKLSISTEGCLEKDALLEILEQQAPRIISDLPVWLRNGESATAPKPDIPFRELQDGVYECEIEMIQTKNNTYGASSSKSEVAAVPLIRMQVGTDWLKFLVDAYSEYSLIQESACKKLTYKVLGVPEWAKQKKGKWTRIELTSGYGFIAGGLSFKQVRLCMTDVNLAVPAGVSGILGRDFLSRFDWDFDFANKEVLVKMAPEDAKAAFPFNMTDMVAVPLTQVNTSHVTTKMLCDLKTRLPGSSVKDRSWHEQPGITCTGLLDTSLPRTLVNSKAAHLLPEASRDDVREVQLSLAIGDGPAGFVDMPVTALVGDTQPFKDLSLVEMPAVILGADVLCCSRMAASFRLKKIWLPRHSV